MTNENNAQNAAEGTQEPKTAQAANQEPKAGQAANPDEGIKDQHGQPGISAAKYEREKKAWEEQKAAWEAEKAEFEKELKTYKATEDSKAELEQKIADLDKKYADREVDFALQAAGCKSVKAARALLTDYEGDVLKLKEAAPYLFETKQTGATGLAPAGAPSTELERKNAARKAAGLPPIKE